jgi:hypothetical protein
MEKDALQKKIDELSALLAAQMKLRQKTFAAQIRKAGRGLPRKLRRDAAYLMRAQALFENPKLGSMVDEIAVANAHRRLKAFLEELDPKDLRKGQILGILSTISLMLIIIFIGVVYILVKRGYV